MLTRSIRLPLAGALAAAVAACHPPAIDAPSLSPRPIERRPIELPDAAAEPETAVDAALTTRLTALVVEAEAGHGRFEAERRRVAGVIASGAAAPEGSEAWVQGQQALSAIEAAQGPVRDTAAAIEALREQPGNFGAGQRAAIDAAAAKVSALGDAEAAAIAQVRPAR